jgi:hypothetical protein
VQKSHSNNRRFFISGVNIRGLLKWHDVTLPRFNDINISFGRINMSRQNCVVAWQVASIRIFLQTYSSCSARQRIGSGQVIKAPVRSTATTTVEPAALFKSWCGSRHHYPLHRLRFLSSGQVEAGFSIQMNTEPVVTCNIA